MSGDVERPVQDRIDQAWENSKDWVMSFDGTPNTTVLVGISKPGLLSGMQALAGQTENFRVTTIPVGQMDAAQFIQLDSLGEALEQLKEGKLEELSANYAVRQEAFDLDIRLVIYWIENQSAAVELYWWTDQVFSIETDQPAQFAALMRYFIEVQNLFDASNLYVTPEGLGQGDEVEHWVEV